MTMQTKDTYKVFAAPLELTNISEVGLKLNQIQGRTIIKITNSSTGLKTYCEALQIEGCNSEGELIYAKSMNVNDCHQLNREIQRSQNLGFEHVSEMLQAEAYGIKSPPEWKKKKINIEMSNLCSRSANILEKALCIGVSTNADFQTLQDSGGLYVSNKWRGYKVYDVEVRYHQNTVSMYHLIIDTDYGEMRHKDATMNNIKNDLSLECGNNWRLFVDNAYLTDSKNYNCEISYAKNGYHVVVYRRLE